MEWRQQSSVSCDEAYLEAQRWVEAVTEKKFGSNNFRTALENGVLLCDLINKINPGIIRRVNRLSTPIAGLDNLNLFLKACKKLGLKEAQLFHPGDLQDLSTRVTVKHQETNRRLKNVLITIYWLGRRAYCDPLYDGPYLNLKAFEGLLGTALSKVLEESSSPRRSSVRDSGFGDSWCSDREESFQLRGGGGGRHRKEDSLDSLDSLGSRAHSISSDATLKGSSEDWCSDAEADSVFSMASNKDSLSYRRSLVVAPKTATQFNQFLPTKDKPSGYVPAPLRKKRAERHEDSRRSWASPMYTEEDGTFSSESVFPSHAWGDGRASANDSPASQLQWAYEYESGSDSDAERPDPDLVLDDLASRRFHSPSPVPPTNFAVPSSPGTGQGTSRGSGSPKVIVVPGDPCDDVMLPLHHMTSISSSSSSGARDALHRPGSVRVEQQLSPSSLFRELYGDSEEEDEDDEVGYADPVQDDLYSRKVCLPAQPPGNVPYDKFLPKFWTPEEDTHIRKIRLGSQRRPWYKKMQGFRLGGGSLKKFGSTSDDSDSDISPWLSSGPSPSGPSPSSPSPSRSHPAEASVTTTRVVGKRLPRNQDDSDGSKSMNDIQVDPAVMRQVYYEERQKVQEQGRVSDDKWQDDLTKWKNRRKSVNSDIVKKKEEREQIEQITYGNGGSRKSRTFKEMQEERETRDRSSIGSRLGSLSYLDEDQDIFDGSVSSPRARPFPIRSNSVDTPYSTADRSFPPSVPSLQEEEPTFAPTAPDREAFPPDTTQEVDGSRVDARAVVRGSSASATAATTTTTTSAGHSAGPRSGSPTAVPMERGAREHPSTAAAGASQSAVTSAEPSASLQGTTEPRRPSAGMPAQRKEAPPSASLDKQAAQCNPAEAKPPGVSRVSASLPRSYRRSDGARLTSVVAPRPFGTRLSSLPQATAMDDSHKRVNGDAEASKKSSVPSRYHQFMTSEDEARSHSSSAHSSGEEEEEEEEETDGKELTSKQSAAQAPPQIKSETTALTVDANKEDYCDMRISLNQKPNSNRDFGFQADWSSSGIHVKSIQPGSPAEMCQLQAGDEVLTVSGHTVADMSFTDWRASMDEALQQGSLVMDIRCHGKNSAPDVTAGNSSLDFTSRKSMDNPATAPSHPVINVATNGLNGGLYQEQVTMRNKESEPISLKNLKRRSEFFEQGGLDTAIPDIPVPALTPSTNRWSWDPEEERRRQEKWQKEQERLLQEKYKRDQEKLEEVWRKAQEEAADSKQQQKPSSLEVNTGGISPHSSLSPTRQPTPPWEDEGEEERRRKEEQEQQRQAEERRRRDEEELELRRLQEQRERREQQRKEEEEKARQRKEEEERKRREEVEMKRQEEVERKRREEVERKRREEEDLRLQRRREEERQEEERRQWEAEQQRRERERAVQQEQQQWDGRSSGVYNVQSELAYADRAKSKSTPELDEVDKPEKRGHYWQPSSIVLSLLEERSRCERDKRLQRERATSQLEQERRHILNAMRYREPERVSGGGAGGEASWRGKSQPSVSQAEQERQQILQEMKKKTQLLTDNSWIRQRSITASAVSQEPVDLPMRRGESLDNLDVPRNSWRSSWTPGSTSSIPNYTRPQSALSGSASSRGGGYGNRPDSATLPSSYSMGSLRGGAGTPSLPWRQQSPSPSPSPATSPEPAFEPRPPQQRSRSVSGKKICTFCDNTLGKGAAMIIESLGLCYHLSCFKCIDCKSDLGGSEAGAEVRIRNKQLYCNTCYQRFKTGQPTSM